MKRIVAITLPELACELARLTGMVHDGPFAVIVDDEDAPPDEPIKPSAILHAVDGRAWQYGARPGQKAAQASAFVGKLQIVRLSKGRILEALGSVAEVALAFGTTAGFDLRNNESRLRDEEAAARYPLGAGAGPYDTVWLDVTGCSRLVGGEDLLCADLRERVGQLGHRARVAIADGPRIAQALARWGRTSETVVPMGKSAEHLAPLPVAALPFSFEQLSWLGRLGILHISDLTLLDRKRLAPRLASRMRRLNSKMGLQAADLVALVAGRDDAPVIAYERPRCIVEQASFDYELEGIEPIFFVLRGLTGRAITRLRARGEACSQASITLEFDRAILRCSILAGEQDAGVTAETDLVLELDLPVPLASEADLLRALHAKIDRLELPAPVRGVRLTLDGLAAQRHHQLAIGKKGNRDPHALPTLLAELSAWLGKDRVGVLESVPAHRPEARSRLAPCDPEAAHAQPARAADPTFMAEPTRLLDAPIEIAKSDERLSGARASLRAGSLVAADHHVFILDHARLVHRLEAVEWWSEKPLHRDYLRAWLHGASMMKAAPARSQPGSSQPGSSQSGLSQSGLSQSGHSQAGSQTGRSHTEHTEACVYVTRDEHGREHAFLHGWYD